MESEKDRFGELMRLLERAQEDIYFAARDQELLTKLRATLRRAETLAKEPPAIHCPKCNGLLENYGFMHFTLDRCRSCGGAWFDKEELDAITRTEMQSPLFTPAPWVP